LVGRGGRAPQELGRKPRAVVIGLKRHGWARCTNCAQRPRLHAPLDEDLSSKGPGSRARETVLRAPGGNTSVGPVQIRRLVEHTHGGQYPAAQVRPHCRVLVGLLPFLGMLAVIVWRLVVEERFLD
jgi:hypothetical protein